MRPYSRFLRIIYALLLIIAIGVIGYMIIERWSFVDALFMTVITTSTVGYGEVHVLSNVGKASRDYFFELVLQAPISGSLSEHINSIIQRQPITHNQIGTLDIHILPIQHASGTNPRFSIMAENANLIKIIREILI